jgi:hypothetical protein
MTDQKGQPATHLGKLTTGTEEKIPSMHHPSKEALLAKMLVRGLFVGEEPWKYLLQHRVEQAQLLRKHLEIHAS